MRQVTLLVRYRHGVAAQARIQEGFVSSLLSPLRAFVLSFYLSFFYRFPLVIRYPQNLARNTGKQGCQTPYSIVPDADMIPSAFMAQKLEVGGSNSEILKHEAN